MKLDLSVREQVALNAIAEGAPNQLTIARRSGLDKSTPPDHEPAPTETATVYQRIATAFNEHPGQVFQVRDLHELLGLPTVGDQGIPRLERCRRHVIPHPDVHAIPHGDGG
ncbi:hypothetical protein ACGF0D_44280, partial [Kitasatospora sp. NPDC048298]